MRQGVGLAKVSFLERVCYFLKEYLTDIRELAAGNPGKHGCISFSKHSWIRILSRGPGTAAFQ